MPSKGNKSATKTKKTSGGNSPSPVTSATSVPPGQYMLGPADHIKGGASNKKKCGCIGGACK